MLSYFLDQILTGKYFLTDYENAGLVYRYCKDWKSL